MTKNDKKRIDAFEVLVLLRASYLNIMDRHTHTHKDKQLGPE